jgi:hypothetical protein
MAVSILLKKHDFSNRNRQAFVANGQTLLDVLRGGFIQYIINRLRGNLVVSVGTASGTSLGQNPGNLLVRAFLDSAPVGNLKSLSPRSLIQQTVFDYGRAIGAGTALTGAAGTFALDLNLIMNFSLDRSPRPIDTALESDAFTSLQIRMQNGGRDTQFTGNDRTFDFSAVTWDIVDQREIMAGHTAVLFEYDIIKQIAAANNNFNITDFAVGRRLLSHLYMTESTNQALVDTILNRLRVQSGSTVFADAFNLDYRANQDYWVTDTAQVQTGLFWLPLSPDMTLGGAIDARQLAQISAQTDVSSPVPGTDRFIIAVRDVLYAEDMGLAPTS